MVQLILDTMLVEVDEGLDEYDEMEIMQYEVVTVELVQLILYQVHQ